MLGFAYEMIIFTQLIIPYYVDGAILKHNLYIN